MTKKAIYGKNSDFYSFVNPIKQQCLDSNDYYPFGSLVPNRYSSSTAYRYGFQGQEKDDELKGEGNSLNYTFRMHDPRVGRFFAIDPLASDYSYNSPYAFSENRVIDSGELEGLETAPMIFPKGTTSQQRWAAIDSYNKHAGKALTYMVVTAAVVLDAIYTRGTCMKILAGAGLLESINETERGHEAAAKGNMVEARRRYANAGEASKLAIFEGVGFIAGKGIATIYSFTKTFTEASSKLALIREAFNISKGKNIAWAEGTVGGESVEIIAHSGSKSSKAGTANVPGASRFFETNVANKNSYDSEIKILETFAQKFKNNPTVKGEITIFSEREFCDSCRNAIFKQFNEIFPNVKIKVGADGIK